MEVSYLDTTTNLGDPSISTIPEKTTVIPPEVSMVESVTKEFRASGITVHKSI